MQERTTAPAHGAPRHRGWMTALLFAASGVLALAAVAVSSARAQAPTGAPAGSGSAETPERGEAPAESRSAAFRAVEGGRQEDIPGGPLLIGAYAVAWVLMLLFVVRIGRLQAATSKELARLEQSLARSEGSDA